MPERPDCVLIFLVIFCERWSVVEWPTRAVTSILRATRYERTRSQPARTWSAGGHRKPALANIRQLAAQYTRENGVSLARDRGAGVCDRRNRRRPRDGWIGLVFCFARRGRIPGDAFLARASLLASFSGNGDRLHQQS